MDRILFFFGILMLIWGSLGQTYNEMDSLLEYLFNESRYNKLIRPLTNQTNVIKVNFTQFVNGVEHFDISTGELLVTGYFEIKWRDEMLTWDPDLYGGKKQIMLPKEKYWKPDFYLTNGPANEESSIYSSVFTPAWVTYEGFVRIIPAGSYKTKCNVDTTFYPYDMHTCNFQFIVSNHDATELLLNTPSHSIHFSEVIEHGEWEIKKTDTEILLIKEENIDNITIPMFQSSLFLKRRPTFELINSFSPLTLMSSLNIATCFIRPNSGERLTFAITLYLSLVLATSATTKRVPENSLKMPYLSYQLLTLNCINTVGVLWSIYIVHYANRKPIEHQRVPKVILKLVLKNREQTDIIKGKHIPVDKAKSIMPFEQTDKAVDEELKEKEESMNENIATVSGLEIAEILDKLYFWVVAASTFIIDTIFMVLTYKSWFM